MDNLVEKIKAVASGALEIVPEVEDRLIQQFHQEYPDQEYLQLKGMGISGTNVITKTHHRMPTYAVLYKQGFLLEPKSQHPGEERITRGVLLVDAF